MKGLFLRFCRWALAMLGISGVISCDGDDDIVAVPEYGVPVMGDTAGTEQSWTPDAIRRIGRIRCTYARYRYI
jgi:hypothetical protein